MKVVALVLALPLALSPGSSNAASNQLKDAGPVVALRDGQVIENLRIRASGVPGVKIQGRKNVIVRNVSIIHRGAPGIECSHASGLMITRVSVTNATPERGGDNPNNIACQHSPHLTLSQIRLRGGASGVYLLESPYARLSFIEGYDFVGAYPRGQLVQFDKSHECLLEDFSVINDPSRSWTEDNVSVYESNNCAIRRGLVDGNNSPSGVGVMFERAFGGLAEDIDAVRQGNGSFSAYPAQDIVFRRTRSRDNICGDQGRGDPMSNALVWAGSTLSRGLRIEDSQYYNVCNPHNLVWSHKVFETIDIAERDFTVRPPIVNRFPFDCVTGSTPWKGGCQRGASDGRAAEP